MRCKFCFATFQDVKKSILPKGHLPKEESIKVVQSLSDFGFDKITFVGGEPTLCPWLSELIQTAKLAGSTTMIVTNGTNLTEKFLKENINFLDWITISIDSVADETNLRIGRAISGKKVISLVEYKRIIDLVKKYNYRLKINTVVCSENKHEDLSEIIEYSKPERWKIFQALPVLGQNDGKIDSLLVSSDDFQNFIESHQHLNSVTTIVSENNCEMTGSYAMVDPAGRFFDNESHEHRYSDSILKVGVEKAFYHVRIDEQKFIDRGGIYNWSSSFNRITISGEVASGKSTVGQLLAKSLNYEFVSIGNKTRSKAEFLGKTIVEFQQMCLNNQSLDMELDKEFSNECNSRKNVVIDYRLGYKFINNAFNIFLDIDEKTAKNRLKHANRNNESYHTISKRNKLFKIQFKNAYSINYTDRFNYQLVVKVEQFETPEEIVNHILNRLNILQDETV